jgi:cell division protein FtsB
MIRLYLLLFIIGTVGSVGYGGYRYVTNLQQQVETLKENNLVLEQAVATNQATIDRMADEAHVMHSLQADLTNRLTSRKCKCKQPS